jgi:hypothetical protein
MRISGIKSLFLCVIMVLAGFVSLSRGDASSIKKVAIVSFTVSDVAGTVRSGSVGTESVSDLINGTINGMLGDAEKKLGKKWTVAKVSSFIDSAAYRKTACRRH